MTEAAANITLLAVILTGEPGRIRDDGTTSRYAPSGPVCEATFTASIRTNTLPSGLPPVDVTLPEIVQGISLSLEGGVY